MIDFNDFDIDETEQIPDEEFANFLKKHHAYKKYVHNLTKYNTIQKFFNRYAKDNYISNAFSWSRTPEGSTYWLKINSDWKSNIMKYQ